MRRNMLLWCPGAMRLVESVIGNGRRRCLAGQDRVVPRLAGDHLPVGSGTLGDDLGEQRAHVAGAPAEAQRQVHRVHAEVADAAVFAAGGDAALPVDRLVRVEVAAMPVAALDLEDAPEAALLRPLARIVCAPGKKGYSEEQRTSRSGCCAISSAMT